MSEIHKIQQSECANVHLTAKDFVQCREELAGIIVAPFNKAHAKGVGYNFSLSEMIYSITKKRLVPICREAHETYFYLQPHDTVLALSYEYLKVDDYIAGDFHSRVRITAQGVGSTSTTLDPGWKGMLLFSLNNPTKRKIKIILSTREDGAITQNPILTLIAWRTTKPLHPKDDDASAENLSLRLDNPPMRIDIWSEVTAKRLRLIGNREYQRFISLVNSLSSFEAKSSYVSWAASLRDMLTELCIAIDAQKSEEAIRAALINIKSVEGVPDSMKKHLEKLTVCIVKSLPAGENLVGYCSSDDYHKIIELSKREIQYLVLCDQVRQIHELISNQISISWRKNLLANIGHQFKKNIGIILATMYFVFLILFGKTADDSKFWQEIVLAFVPLVVSMVFHITEEHK